MLPDRSFGAISAFRGGMPVACRLAIQTSPNVPLEKSMVCRMSSSQREAVWGCVIGESLHKPAARDIRTIVETTALSGKRSQYTPPTMNSQLLGVPLTTAFEVLALTLGAALSLYGTARDFRSNGNVTTHGRIAIGGIVLTGVFGVAWKVAFAERSHRLRHNEEILALRALSKHEDPVFLFSCGWRNDLDVRYPGLWPRVSSPTARVEVGKDWTESDNGNIVATSNLSAAARGTMEEHLEDCGASCFKLLRRNPNHKWIEDDLSRHGSLIEYSGTETSAAKLEVNLRTHAYRLWYRKQFQEYGSRLAILPYDLVAHRALGDLAVRLCGSWVAPRDVSLQFPNSRISVDFRTDEACWAWRGAGLCPCDDIVLETHELAFGTR